MPSESITTTTEQLIDQRLDAIDQALLGLYPRTERLEMVAKVEARIRDLLTGGDSAIEDALRAPAANAIVRSGPVTQVTNKRRSKLALASGLVGIISVALMLMLPIVFVLAELLASILSEGILIGLLGFLSLATVGAGTFAVVFGIASLVLVVRNRSQIFGQGWAITGLCTGPIPVLAGCVPVALIGLPMLISSAVSVSVAPSQPTACYAPGAAGCQTCVAPATAAVYSPPSPVAGYGAVSPYPVLPLPPGPLPLPLQAPSIPLHSNDLTTSSPDKPSAKAEPTEQPPTTDALKPVCPGPSTNSAGEPESEEKA
jgi:hypothetical protein